ncbi:MAG: cation:proton antiporter [Acidobacteriota bacterium]
MHLPVFDDPSLTIALALAAGMLAQALARHLRVPGIVVLLASGVLLGPDFLGLVRPASLGATLPALVGFAVAVILFEGGMNLSIPRIRREGLVIRRLVTVGAVVTAVGATAAARYLLDWDWRPSILFGTLMIVTGPTVVTPLLRRIRVKQSVATILEAEGVLVDAIGAVLAVVAFEVLVSPSGAALAVGALDAASRLVLGAVMGAATGFLIAALLRIERLVPEGLENVFTLAFALLAYQLSDGILHESGIVTVTVAGMVVGNVRSRALGDLREFKEQLTTMFIGMLFVLLAASVSVEQVLELGIPGLLTVLTLMFVVRPLNVLAGTWKSDLDARERLFLCWLAPRGIVAAAVASLFSQSLVAAGVPGGEALQAMVFLVIGMTVLVQGLSGGLIARALGLRRPTNTGYVLLGANDLARAMARLLVEAGNEVILLDSSPDACKAAEEEGLRVLFGSGLQEAVLYRADLAGKEACIALTANDEANLLFARKAREEFRVPRVWVALRRGHVSVTEHMVEAAGARVLFGVPRHIDLWIVRLEREIARIERWTRREPGEGEELLHLDEETRNSLLPLAIRRGGKLLPLDDTVAVRKGDELHALVLEEQADRAHAWLQGQGWEAIAAPEETAAETTEAS